MRFQKTFGLFKESSDSCWVIMQSARALQLRPGHALVTASAQPVEKRIPGHIIAVEFMGNWGDISSRFPCFGVEGHSKFHAFDLSPATAYPIHLTFPISRKLMPGALAEYHVHSMIVLPPGASRERTASAAAVGEGYTEPRRISARVEAPACSLARDSVEVPKLHVASHVRGNCARRREAQNAEERRVDRSRARAPTPRSAAAPRCGPALHAPEDGVAGMDVPRTVAGWSYAKQHSRRLARNRDAGRTFTRESDRPGERFDEFPPPPRTTSDQTHIRYSRCTSRSVAFGGRVVHVRDDDILSISRFELPDCPASFCAPSPAGDWNVQPCARSRTQSDWSIERFDEFLAPLHNDERQTPYPVRSLHGCSRFKHDTYEPKLGIRHACLWRSRRARPPQPDFQASPSQSSADDPTPNFDFPRPGLGDRGRASMADANK
ncbi:hypothetical protein AURDEDRAFT_161010 [Auricularia subglabra TFB-10046 SS5]|nr:hypothetical protein AURDEDRAFT_161010 [Auricularia subglabra TFB-10046 SS5]